jgi:hypothetical protein
MITITGVIMLKPDLFILLHTMFRLYRCGQNMNTRSEEIYFLKIIKCTAPRMALAQVAACYVSPEYPIKFSYANYATLC